MDILGQSALLVALTSFALGASVLAKNVRNKLYLAFAVVTALLTAWALFFFLEKLWGGGRFYRFHLIFNLWLAPAALVFIQVLVRIQDRMSRRLLEASALFAALLSIAIFVGVGRVPWVRQLIYFTPGFIALQTLHLMWVDRRLKHGVPRPPKKPTVGLGKRNLIYLGALLVLGTSVMDHVPWSGPVVPVIGNLALTAYIYFLSQAITQQRLLNFRALFSRFMVLLALALTLTGIYSLLYAWIAGNFALFLLNSFIVSFLIVMLIEPLRALVAYVTQRLLTKKHQRLQEILREGQRRLTGVVDPAPLFQAILEVIGQTLAPQAVSLYVLRGDGTRYYRVRAIGLPPDADFAREVLPDHPLIASAKKLLGRGELPMLLDQIIESEMDRSISRTRRTELRSWIDGLHALGGNLLIPLVDANRIPGFVVLASPAPPEPWGGNWSLLQTMRPYFELAGRTLLSLEVYAKSREKERLAALGEMAAGLAHEIRNPLGAIKGAAQFLDPSADRPEKEFLEVIVEEVDRLNRVVTRFLEYSKQPKQESTPIDLNDLLERILELLRPTLSSGIMLEYHPYEKPVSVAGSPEQLKQVFLNLIQNSLRAIGDRLNGRVRIQTLLTQRAGVPLDAIVEIEDNGRGIKREDLAKLFIPFFTTSPSGTGLGLSISQKIVEAHHGRIEVASEEGQFARFSVVLPSRPIEATHKP